jgi:hypothetical protein
MHANGSLKRRNIGGHIFQQLQQLYRYFMALCRRCLVSSEAYMNAAPSNMKSASVRCLSLYHSASVDSPRHLTSLTVCGQTNTNVRLNVSRKPDLRSTCHARSSLTITSPSRRTDFVWPEVNWTILLEPMNCHPAGVPSTITVKMYSKNKNDIKTHA